MSGVRLGTTELIAQTIFW